MTEPILRLLVLLAIFATIFLVSQLVLGAMWRNRLRFAAVNRRLRMIREGSQRADVMANLRKNSPSDFNSLPHWLAARLRGFQRTMLAAGVPWTYLQVLSAMAIGFALSLALILMGVSVAGFTVSGGVVVLTLALAATVAIAVPYTILNILAQRRRKRIEQQFPVSLDIFVRALRSGHPVASAIALITEEMEDPIGSEFGLVSDEVSYGVELTDALESMANRWDLEDMRMFVVSLSVQMETGGNLAEILENLSEVIRARASLYLKVRALSSEGRMTAWILSVLPAITFTLMFMVNPGFYLNTAGDPIFIGGFAGLMLLYVIGIFWIKHLVNIKV